jgi:hypothetical protein
VRPAHLRRSGIRYFKKQPSRRSSCFGLLFLQKVWGEVNDKVDRHRCGAQSCRALLSLQLYSQFLAVQLLYESQNELISRKVCSDRRATRLLHPAINSPPSEVKNSSRSGAVLHFRLVPPFDPLPPLFRHVSLLLAVQLLYDWPAIPGLCSGNIQSSSTFQRPFSRSRARNAKSSGTSSH